MTKVDYIFYKYALRHAGLTKNQRKDFEDKVKKEEK